MFEIRSIRRFILATVTSALVIGGLAAALANYNDAREQVEELFDAELAQMARVLQSIFTSPAADLKHDLGTLVYEDFRLPESEEESEDEDHHEAFDTGHKYEKKLAFQIWNQNNQLLMQSAAAAENELPWLSKGFQSINLSGNAWRVFTLQDVERGLWIQVAQRDDVRSELTLEIAEHLLITPVMVIPVLAILVWYMVGFAFAPLRRISREISQRHINNLEVIDTSEVPREVAGLVESINSLLFRVKEQAENERRFTADAAHELRTPLAAMKIQLQNALRRVDNEKAKASLDKSLKALNRLVHLVEQLLLLSRLDATRVLERPDKVSVNDVITTIIDELDFQLVEKQVRVEFEANAEVNLSAHGSLIYSLIKNFIDNALRYSPEGGAIKVILEQDSLCIEDGGPGIPDDLLSAVFGRFYRVEGDASNGVGLGLAICQKIVDVYGYQLSVKNREGSETGLNVLLTFSRAN